MFIYLITNTKTEKIYVGQTKRPLLKRLKAHFYEAMANKTKMYLHHSIRKHGTENFKIELLEECAPENIYERERFWIKKLKASSVGYNQHEGGRGGCLNPTKELSEKLRKAKEGYVPWNKGKRGVQLYTDEFRQKMSEIKTSFWKSKGHVRVEQIRNCLTCKSEFSTKLKTKRFCSKKCVSDSRRKTVTFNQ